MKHDFGSARWADHRFDVRQSDAHGAAKGFDRRFLDCEPGCQAPQTVDAVADAGQLLVRETASEQLGIVIAVVDTEVREIDEIETYPDWDTHLSP